MDKITKRFYARTANTGLTYFLFCVMTQHGKPALFVPVEGMRGEIEDLYTQYVTGKICYHQEEIIGIAEAKKIIKKYDLTGFSRMITFS